ncbi:MAG: SDR family oxidoreductase [Woeseia sp.]|nr:SDR family oxidoreductase [Woeseia sp.]MBT8096768.1 SDR family oxidoreductase [Woeseia sp.]NNE62128.1 SDR family oxidoreductase [Woeseia sp.]NNL54054.1 SDR family oxidoreductase [Woeseia sp.]
MSKVLVTGCNRGIGLELVRQFAARGDDVIAVCRSSSPELDKLDVRVIDKIDVSVGKDVASLQRSLADDQFDVLLNNAGILRGDNFDNLDFDDMLEQFRVNTIGPLRVTRALLGCLHKGSKVGIVSSRVGSIEDNGSGNNYGYRASKTAVNMVGKNLAHDLKPRGIAVALLHPGLVATEMTGRTGIAPAEAATGLIARLDELTLATSGGFWHANGERLPW